MALPADYQSRSAEEKLEILWKEVSAKPYADDGLPKQVPSTLARLKLFTVAHNRVSFEHIGDEMPPGRTKLVHTYGTVAKVTMKVDDARGYTGLFASGGPGLLRFSDAEGGGRRPTLAIKFMRDGKPSVNFFGLPYKLRAPEDNDPLGGVYANGTEPPVSLDKKAVAWAFQRTADALGGKRLYAVYLPLHDLAETHTDGSSVPDAKVPDRIELHPTKAAREAAASHKDWRRSLAAIPAGTTLFDLKIAPDKDADAEPYGTLVLDTPFIASLYGDERLFFQHHVGPT